MVVSFLLEFLLFFGIISGLYIIPAAIFHYLYYRKSDASKEKIQPKFPSKKQMIKEFWLSMSTVAIFALGTTILLQIEKEGGTTLYYEWSDHSMLYNIGSFFICLLIHDTYFYWAHRFMHWKPIFKYFHIGHHRSMVPTPWASLSFQPLEAIVQFGTFVVILFVLPVHAVVFSAYLVYDTVVNTAGHNGFELVPKWMSKFPILKLGNTVTHHEIHHQDFNSNYGAFYNFWDKIMGTFREDMKAK